jgi:hypothetical protein
MASKKSTKKSSKAAATPPKELIADIQKVLKKHKFKMTVTMKAKANATSPCPFGSSLKPVNVKKPDGSIVTELRCVKNKSA